MGMSDRCHFYLLRATGALGKVFGGLCPALQLQACDTLLGMLRSVQDAGDYSIEEPESTICAVFRSVIQQVSSDAQLLLCEAFAESDGSTKLRFAAGMVDGDVLLNACADCQVKLCELLVKHPCQARRVATQRVLSKVCKPARQLLCIHLLPQISELSPAVQQTLLCELDMGLATT